MNHRNRVNRRWLIAGGATIASTLALVALVLLGPWSGQPRAAAPSGAQAGQDAKGLAASTPPTAVGPTASAPTTPSPSPSLAYIWGDEATPAVAAANDAQAVEVGVKFRAATSGYIAGLRFYKGATNTGSHVGHLWSSTGTLLATATFANESASGWQQVAFTAPVAITANTTYIASYHAPAGRYAVDSAYFASKGTQNGPIRALAEGEEGPNGVFKYGGSGSFPTEVYRSSNYWVDVVFTLTAETVSLPTPRPPAPSATVGSPNSAATPKPNGTPGTAAAPGNAASPAPAGGGTLTSLVVGNGGFATIGQAIQAAAPGATIRLKAGTYPEQVSVDKPLTLLADGDGPVWIDGDCARDYGVVVGASDVTLRGFGIKRTNATSIFVDGRNTNPRPARTVVDAMTVQDFNCANTNYKAGQQYGGFAGFYAGEGVRITNSTFTHSVELNRPQRGDSDCIWFKSNTERPSGGGHYIAGNTITGCRDGIGGEVEDDPHGSFDHDTVIENNIVRDCYDDGIQVEGGNANVVVRNNRIEGCGTGIGMAPNLVGPLTIEHNVISSSNPGFYGNLLCMKVGNGGTGTAYITENECRISGTAGETGDGIAQTNPKIGSIVARRNIIQATRYVIELTSNPGGSFDEAACTRRTPGASPSGRTNATTPWRACRRGRAKSSMDGGPKIARRYQRQRPGPAARPQTLSMPGAPRIWPRQTLTHPRSPERMPGSRLSRAGVPWRSRPDRRGRRRSSASPPSRGPAVAAGKPARPERRDREDRAGLQTGGAPQPARLGRP